MDTLDRQRRRGHAEPSQPGARTLPRRELAGVLAEREARSRSNATTTHATASCSRSLWQPATVATVASPCVASAAAGVGRPQFSPDGKRLVFDRQNIAAKPKDGHATLVANLDGTSLRRVTPWSLRAGDHPDWSPDGRLILVRSNANGPDFSRQGNLFVVRPNGTGLRQLTHFGGRVRLLQNGSFSPDGDRSCSRRRRELDEDASLRPAGRLHLRLDGTHRTPVTSRAELGRLPRLGLGRLSRLTAAARATRARPRARARRASAWSTSTVSATGHVLEELAALLERLEDASTAAA